VGRITSTTAPRGSCCSVQFARRRGLDHGSLVNTSKHAISCPGHPCPAQRLERKFRRFAALGFWSGTKTSRNGCGTGPVAQSSEAEVERLQHVRKLGHLVLLSCYLGLALATPFFGNSPPSTYSAAFSATCSTSVCQTVVAVFPSPVEGIRSGETRSQAILQEQAPGDFGGQKRILKYFKLN
jgi:hypothetical protein